MLAKVEIVRCGSHWNGVGAWIERANCPTSQDIKENRGIYMVLVTCNIRDSFCYNKCLPIPNYMLDGRRWGMFNRDAGMRDFDR